MNIEKEELKAIAGAMGPMQALCAQVWADKYGKVGGDATVDDNYVRVARALARDDAQAERLLAAMHAGLTGGGRIMAGAGADTQVTLGNCFVQPINDWMTGTVDGAPGITDALAQSAETMRRGGGVGYDFSPLRPAGALVRGTNSQSSGPLSYMKMFDRMCDTVQSAGARRGAQMGILRCDHPDIEAFIAAKQPPDFQAMGLSGSEVGSLMALIRGNSGFGWTVRKAFATLSNFNISVAVTDEFMAAVHAGADWALVHTARPYADSGLGTIERDGQTLYVYRTVKAVELWRKILKSTYEFGDPGVVFISRVNQVNNLWYAEQIFACNPCGEQFLPAYGVCCLGSPNLARFVSQPFTAQAAFNYKAFGSIARIGVEMLDRVLDVTLWPLAQQKNEAMAKRRIGLGYMGLADAMWMLGIRYGSAESVQFTAEVSKCLRDNAYMASCDLAERFGAFPLFDADKYLKPGTFASTLPDEIQQAIRAGGIRNSHLLSIAPTGTTSIAYGNNCSSGIEPIFAVRQTRTRLMDDGSRTESILLNSAALVREKLIEQGVDVVGDEIPPTALTMTVDEHLKVVAAAAPYIDSAISKTINIPADYPFEDFVRVYETAHALGLKGITTFRPNDMVGSVLADADATVPVDKGELHKAVVDDGQGVSDDRRMVLKVAPQLAKLIRSSGRPETVEVDGKTYWVKHPLGSFAVVVNHHQKDGRIEPLEVFIAGNEQPRGISALAKSLSLDLQTGDMAWVARKLQSLARTEGADAFDLKNPATGAMLRMPSLVGGLAFLVAHRLTELGVLPVDENEAAPVVAALLSQREPKSGPEGTRGLHFDVYNQATGDDFLMAIKEVEMPDGSIRPYSVWFSGNIPPMFNGIAKCLSLDLRVSDPAWGIGKLRKLARFAEPQGDFMAPVPGGKRQNMYPSTIAYIAELLLFRMSKLGNSGCKVGEVPIEDDASVGVAPLTTNAKMCPQCGVVAVVKRDGCEVCDACGHTGSCG